ARAAQLPDSSVEVPGGFFGLFGKPARESACECERSSGMMLGPVLNLVNGPVIGEALRDPNNRLARLLAEQQDNGKVVEELFLAVLSRPPSPKELAEGVKSLSGNNDEVKRLEELNAQAVAALAAYEKELPARQAAWEKTLNHTVPST